MSLSRLLLLSSLLVLAGCRWPVREETDQAVLELASRPFDQAPAESAEDKPKAEKTAPAAKESVTEANAETSEPVADVRTVALMQADRTPEKPAGGLPKYELKVPSEVPGSEAPLIDFRKMSPEQKQQAIRRLYPELPPLPDEPAPQPGPNGRPYTLADLQKLAADNSPTLRQAASDVEAAEGTLIQAKTYPNPTVGYVGIADEQQHYTPASRVASIDQPITTAAR